MTASDDLRFHIPATVSSEAAAIMRVVGNALAAMPRREPPVTLADFDERLAQSEAFAFSLSAPGIAALAPDVEEWRAGGVPVLVVRPRIGKPGLAPLVYIHGGGFSQGSARSTLKTAALAGARSGRTVYSIDYTLTPRGTWRSIGQELRDAWAAIAERHQGGRIGLFGDSAGACLAATLAAALIAHDASPPAALALFSPLVDLTGAGDTNATLAHADLLDRAALLPALRAYADETAWGNPEVSPIYANLRGFPPTLIQVGTRERLLSDSVRFHRALRQAGVASRMEAYEGMPHVFQSFLSDTPEGREAWAELDAFWSEHLE